MILFLDFEKINNDYTIVKVAGTKHQDHTNN